MTSRRFLRRVAPSLMAALLLPFLIQALQLSIIALLSVNLGYATYAISIACGLMFLVRGLGKLAIPIAVVYVPAMFLSLIYVTLALGVRFLGEGP